MRSCNNCNYNIIRHLHELSIIYDLKSLCVKPTNSLKNKFELLLYSFYFCHMSVYK